MMLETMLNGVQELGPQVFITRTPVQGGVPLHESKPLDHLTSANKALAREEYDRAQAEYEAFWNASHMRAQEQPALSSTLEALAGMATCAVTQGKRWNDFSRMGLDPTILAKVPARFFQEETPDVYTRAAVEIARRSPRGPTLMYNFIAKVDKANSIIDIAIDPYSSSSMQLALNLLKAGESEVASKVFARQEETASMIQHASKGFFDIAQSMPYEHRELLSIAQQYLNAPTAKTQLAHAALEGALRAAYNVLEREHEFYGIHNTQTNEAHSTIEAVLHLAPSLYYAVRDNVHYRPAFKEQLQEVVPLPSIQQKRHSLVSKLYHGLQAACRDVKRFLTTPLQPKWSYS